MSKFYKVVNDNVVECIETHKGKANNKANNLSIELVENNGSPQIVSIYLSKNSKNELTDGDIRLGYYLARITTDYKSLV